MSEYKRTKIGFRALRIVSVALILTASILTSTFVLAYAPPLSGTHSMILFGTMQLNPSPPPTYIDTPPGSLGTYVDVNFDGAGGYNYVYKGWCLDSGISILLDTAYNVTLYDYFNSSYSSDNAGSYDSGLPDYWEMPHIKWNKIAYVLNHKLGLYTDIQNVLWHFSDPALGSYGSSQAYNDMITAADTYGGSFVPTAGQIRLVICDPGNGGGTGDSAVPLRQLIIFEYYIIINTAISSPTATDNPTVTDTATIDPVNATGDVQFQYSTTGSGGTWNTLGADKTDSSITSGTAGPSDAYSLPSTFWTSYQDAGHTTELNTFTATYHVVYMQGSNYTPSTSYKVAFYDGANNKVNYGEGGTSDGSGVLTKQIDLSTFPDNAPGTWHCVVYDNSKTPPGTYIANDPNAAIGNVYLRAYYHNGDYEDAYSADASEPLHRDDGFIVLGESLPEFPTPLAGLTVIALCGGVYWWIRKRKTAGVCS
jgi:hypothetical protein